MTRLGLQVHGIVQGVGFRPFVRRAALACGVTGWVRNGTGGVRIEVQGSDRALDGFLEALARLPPPASIAALEREVLDERRESDFLILASAADAPVAAVLPADLAPCAECLREIDDPEARRYRYPFTNCTACGPRYSIVLELPYDRGRTSMRAFAMCSACEAEYRDPDDRRYHAQPIACPRCGPQLALLSPAGAVLARAEAALDEAAGRLRRGEVLALRGVGGFQLLCDARDAAAVARLRARKRRPDRPFAVLFASSTDVAAIAAVGPAERAALTSPAAPIVLLPLTAPDALPPEVTRASPWLGAMLPASPLHHLLMRACLRPLVCTSANRSGEPLAIDTDEAVAQLGDVADAFLSHDRPIVRPIDDAVLAVRAGTARVLRRARGQAPLAIARTCASEAILALGAHDKGTVALARRGEILCSQHLGGLASARGRDLLERTARDMCAFFQALPAVVACDAHPDYVSTRLAEELARGWSARLERVQHHHAHIAAVMAEHDLEAEVLGLAWDGVGLGSDGTIWGSEALVCLGAGFRRVGHLGCFPLPGAERAMRSPRRSALGLLAACGRDVEAAARRWFTPGEARVLARAIERGVQSPLCSSMGRLFDAVACLLGLALESSFEGHAALALEACAARSARQVAPYPFPLLSVDGVHTVALAPLLEAIERDRRDGVAPEESARAFHLGLIELAVGFARAAGVRRVALGGGCFANGILAAGIARRLAEEGFAVYAGHEVPPGDNAVAVGQAHVAALRQRPRPC
jgi:hydrogenase maturation protein HypF